MQTENNEGKVVSLFGQSEDRPTKAKSAKTAEEDFDFDAIMKKNADKSSRLNKDRKKANRGVVRSYRLKH